MPLKTGMKTIKNMPEQLINTVDEVVEGFNKVFHTKSSRTLEASKVGASLDIEVNLADFLFDFVPKHLFSVLRVTITFH